MRDIHKIANAKITQTAAKTKGKQSGGAMTRLRCGGLTAEQNELFSKKDEWSIAIGTDWAIIPTLYFVKPKKQGKNNQNSLKLRQLDLSDIGMTPNLCPNFDRKQSLFDIIKHYSPEWEVAVSPKDRPSIHQEFNLDFLMLEDKYSKRGLLVIVPANNQVLLRTLTVNDRAISGTLIESMIYHLSKLRLYENVEDFLVSWKRYVSLSTIEKDIEQKRDDLERVGIQCYFKREGVDAPASRLTLITPSRQIEFNIDIELKHDATRFFNRTEATNIRKYPRLPILVVANHDSSNEPIEQQLLHPTISLSTLLDNLDAALVSALPIMASLEQEIERLNEIVLKESSDLKKLGSPTKSKRSRKKAS